MEQENLVVGTAEGELLSVFLPVQSVEVVGKVEGGILQMSSSPDGELLAVATGLGLLLLMNQDWEVLYEISLDEQYQYQGAVTNTCRVEAQKLWTDATIEHMNRCKLVGAGMASSL